MAINTKAFALLVSMGQAAKPASKAVKEGREKLQGAYNMGVEAAILCGDLASFTATIEKLESDIRYNRDNLAIKFGADKRKEPSEKGEKYRVPGSVSNVKSVLTFAFEHGVSLTEKDGKPSSYGVIRKANQAVRAQIEAAKGETLDGIDKLRWQCEQAAIALRAHVGDMSEADLKAAYVALMAFVPGVQVETKAEHAARETRKSAKARKSAQSGEELAKAA